MPLRENDLRPPAGANRPRKRVGRGSASGTGTYAGKGLKGQKARSGHDLHLAFEGGQMPMVRRLARRRGFTNPFRVTYTPINLFRLNKAFPANAEVTGATLAAARLLDNANEPFKILATGEVDRPLRVRAARISAAARTKIEAAGGQVEELHAARTEPGDAH